MNLTEPLPVVYTAQSKHFFYCRDAVCVYVLSKGCIPLNPFRIFDYFLNDRVDRDLVRRANFNLIRKSDELWGGNWCQFVLHSSFQDFLH